jgi:hypothetical protein
VIESTTEVLIDHKLELRVHKIQVNAASDAMSSYVRMAKVMPQK